MLNAAIYIVFSILLIVCALLLLVVLMQRPKQEGLGAAFGAQMTDQAFGAQTTDVLKKGTVLFGSLFMGLCFILAVLMNARFQQQKSNLTTEAVAAPAVAEQTAAAKTPAPAETPAAPAAVTEDLEKLISQPTETSTAPAPAEPAPATPSAAEVPADAQ